MPNSHDRKNEVVSLWVRLEIKTKIKDKSSEHQSKVRVTSCGIEGVVTYTVVIHDGPRGVERPRR